MAAKNPKAKITAVELNADLLRLALTQQKDPAKLSFISSDAESFLRRWNINQHDLIFLDPPRSGATEYIMKALAWSEASQIIYLSCHPASLGRDLAWFFSANATAPRKYQLKRIQAFEMFPQTDHVETLVELRVD